MNLSVEVILMRVKLLVVLSILSSGCSDPNAESCARMQEIGSNSEKITYLKSWIEERISQDEFIERFGLHGRISALDDRASFLVLDLDFDLLGIDARYGFVELHRKMEQGVIYSQDSKIIAVSIGDLRNSVVLDLREKIDSDQEPSLESMIGGLRLISEGVLVSCR